MTTLVPRPPYTPSEVAQLYPPGLELQHVQVLLRHGERTPISSRFRNTGLGAYWPYCNAANEFKSAVLNADQTWDSFSWKRQLETFGEHNAPAPAVGAAGAVEGICQPGELTDRGRETTLALGQRLRKLYVDQLGFLPAQIDGNYVKLRSSPIPRALESVQQVFNGLYPSAQRGPGFHPPTISTRAIRDETIFPNETACQRLAELYAAFGHRTADEYNDSPQMDAINKQLRKYMPPGPNGEPSRIAVDSKPRLNGILDTINATLAHGSATRLPSAFYDAKTIETIDKICVTEWYSGYRENNEYRTLGIGALVADLTQSMVEHVQNPRAGDGSKIYLAGCHDTSLAATLASLGAFDPRQDRWPSYTSSVAFELFRAERPDSPPSAPQSVAMRPTKTWWSPLFGGGSLGSSKSHARTPLAQMSPQERVAFDDYYVRVRYNDRPMSIPYCKAAGRHYENDESFCTLSAFKEVVDSFTPVDWKRQCGENLGTPGVRVQLEPPLGL